MKQESILKIADICKSFGGLQAVHDVSFELKQGESLGIIGPNGSGKTTLVNLITGFVTPSSGDVFFRDKRITNMRPNKRVELGIARTFQMVKPFYNMAAYKNIIIPLYSKRVKKLEGGKYGDRDDVAIDLLEEVGFEKDSLVPYKVAGTLPHGYLKRLELARALALRPQLLILDELYSGMSMSEVASTLPLIERIKEEGTTLIMVEHRLRELFRVVDRVVVLNFGQKIAEGSSREVMEIEEVKKAYIGSEEVTPDIFHTEDASEKMEMKNLLKINNLMVFYENALALNDLSLEVNKGEIVGVFGSNSAGKSTLMNAISGLLMHLRYKEERKGGERITILGEVKFEGQDILYTKPSHRVEKGIVLCRERHPIFRESSVIENLRISGHLGKRHAVQEKMNFVFDLFPHLKKLRKARAGMLSGGEQQMLAIGIALVASPSLLLMDEPLLGLSPGMQTEVVRALKKIRQEGITILITEQYAAPIMPIVDRGYVVESGTFVVSGTRDELMNNPEVKAAYLGM
jgi:ABC-type branched-subunit amino acid transport system ATPase component